MSKERKPFPFLGALTALIVAIGGLAPLVKEISSLNAAGHPGAVTVVVQNLGASWVCGTRQLSGMAPCPTPSQPSPPQDAQTSPIPKPSSSRFRNNALGYLEQHIPISESEWTLQPAGIPRVIRFDMRVVARGAEVEADSYLITLRREDGAVCAVRLDIGGGGRVAKGKSCQDNVPENLQHVYSVTIEPPSKAVAVTMNARAERPQ